MCCTKSGSALAIVVGLWLTLPAAKVLAQDCAPLPDGIVSWWPGEGDATDIVDDNAGVLAGGVTFADGMVGQAFLFNGVDGRVEIPHNPNQNTGSQATIEAWVYPSTNGHGRPILQKRSTSNVGGFTLETADQPFSPENSLNWVIWIGGSPQSLVASSVLTVGNWQHVAATYNGTVMKIYVNGVERASRPMSGAIDAVTDPLVFGRNVVNPVGFAWNGLIDELSLYARALDPDEIQTIVDAGSAGKCLPQ